MSEILVSVVMPSLDEEEAIGRTIEEIPAGALRRKGYGLEIIVMDGGSRDRTVEIARGKGARVIAAERGYGRQYRAGFAAAAGAIIVTADSDCSYPMGEIPALLDLLRERDLEFISVNRFGRMPPGAMRTLNRLGNIFLTAVTNMLFPVRLRDSQSGMWVFRREILPRLVLTSDGMPFSEEIKIEAFLKVRSLEVPGSYRKRVGEVKLRAFRDGWRNLLFLVRKRLGTGRRAGTPGVR